VIDLGRIAIFLDRDGVLNRLVHNAATGRYESPHRAEDFEFMPGVLPALVRLQARGVSLFVVSNQPSAALGKTTLANLDRIHEKFEAGLRAAGVEMRAFYYCYHHPKGTIPPYAGPCQCRKPSPFFLREALRAFSLRAAGSWMIGDRDTDVECGRLAGCQTIAIECPESAPDRGQSQPTLAAADFPAAAHLLHTRWDGDDEPED
jgi:D-glycero-D-manno-heptose 1,7-bisphosphate phosphatase